MSKTEDIESKKIQAEDQSIAIGSIDVEGSVSGKITIGHTIGYTVDEVSALIEQITTTFQPKDFDGRCPYKGLDVFREEDAELFFGREMLVADLVERLGGSRTVFITGPSGSGKSSLVRAGLLPALQGGAIKNSDHWLYQTIKPGRDPIESMALAFSRLKSPELGKYFRENIHEANILHECTEAALSSREDQRLVIFIDQYEEIFTQVSSEKERILFLDVLTQAARIENGRAIFLFAMRSDFVSNCATYPKLNDLLNQQFVQIGAMQPDELVSAIAQPALRVGLQIDPDLIAQIINDMEGEPGALPLMQFALKDLFDAEQAKGGVIALTRQAYLRRGGIQKSLERHADASFGKLEKHEQELARSIFSGLIEIGRGTQDTRRTALFDELVPASTKATEIGAIVSKLADARLITTDEQAGKDLVTIAHEKLIDAWPWLKKLVNENRDVIALQNEIAGDANEWEQQKRDPSYLYRGARLVNASEQLETKKLVLSGTANEFVQAGIARQRREKLVRYFSISTIIVSVIAGVLLFSYLSTANSKKLAELSERSANTQQAIASTSLANAEEAQSQEKIALARQIAAQAQSIFMTGNSKQMIAVLLALQSMNMYPSIEAVQVLQNSTIARSVSNMHHENMVGTIAFSPDGKYVVSGSWDRSARVWDAFSGGEIARMPHEGNVISVVFSPNSKYIASGSWDNTARVWEATTGKEIARVTHEQRVNGVACSPDGKYVASGSDDHTARVWETTTGQEIARMTHQARVNVIAFSPDGNYIASGSDDHSVRVWEVVTGQEIAQFTHEGNVISLSYSPDGSYVVSGSSGNDDYTARVWEATTGQEIARTEYDDSVNSVAFSSDSQYVVSASGNHIVQVWEATTGIEISQMIHDSNVRMAAFSPDGHYVVSASRDGTARVWETKTGKEIARMTHEDRVWAVSFSPDGRYAVSSSSDHTVRVWEATIGREVARMSLDLRVWSVAFSLDGKYIASGSGDHTARVWDVVTGEEITRVTHEDGVNSVAFSPSSKYVVSGSGDHTVRVWETETGKEVVRMTHDEGLKAVAFSLDGKYIASGSADRTARVWDVATGKEISRVTHNDEVRAVAFSPDGKYVVSGGLDRTTRMWVVATGQEIENARMTHDGSVNALAFSPDGQYLAAGSGDQIIRIWEAATGKEVLTLTHDSNVRSIAFSPDGNYIVSGSRDYTVRVWEVASGKEVTRIIHDERINSVVFSPDGKYIVSGGEDNYVRIWLWRPADLQEKACTRLTRNLTQVEWEQYLGDEPYQPVCPNVAPEHEGFLTETP